MPTATPFTALGRGNGFPYCPRKINVLDRGDGQPYDYWTTLDGFNKESTGVRFDSDLRNSLISAMKFYWNLKGIEALAEQLDDQTIFGDDSGSVSSVQLDDSNEPYRRVCPFYPFAEETDSFCFNRIGFDTQSGGLEILRFYKGDTNDESNFVGYAAGYIPKIGVLLGQNATSFAGASILARARVEIGCAFDDDPNPRSWEYEDIGYVTLNDLHFVCRASTEFKTESGSSNAQHTENASALTASASQTIYTDNYSASASISELVFWTY